MEKPEEFRPALVAWANVQRKGLGRKKCRRLGPGAMIDELKLLIPENGTGAYIDGARSDMRMLQMFCAQCGRCPELRTK